jgi:hypothetical protein
MITRCTREEINVNQRSYIIEDGVVYQQGVCGMYYRTDIDADELREQGGQS